MYSCRAVELPALVVVELVQMSVSVYVFGKEAKVAAEGRTAAAAAAVKLLMLGLLMMMKRRRRRKMMLLLLRMTMMMMILLPLLPLQKYEESCKRRSKGENDLLLSFNSGFFFFFFCFCFSCDSC